MLLRLLQGLAIGGEYGGVVTYVAEHAPRGRRGFYTGWIQTTAIARAAARAAASSSACAPRSARRRSPQWGWRIPFLLSALLLAIGVWVRLEPAANRRRSVQLKRGGGASRKPLAEAFGRWRNLQLVLIALFGLVAGQAVVWYTGQFQALFFLTLQLKVDADHGKPADCAPRWRWARRCSSCSARCRTASAASRSS